MADKKITELSSVSTLPDNAVFTAVDSTRSAGDQNVKISKTDLASDLGGGIPDAPADGNIYGRQDNDWVEVTGGTTGTLEQALIFSASDETSDLEVGADLLTFAMPFDITLTDVRAFVVTAPTGANLEVDVLKNGVSILSTNITIDAGENNSENATTPPVISDVSLSKDDVISVDLIQIGATVAGAGLKITLIYEVSINIS